MRVTTVVVLGLTGFGLSACARPPPEEPEPVGGQTYCEALELMCEVDRRAGIADQDDPLERSQKREDFLSDNVKNPDAIYFRTLLKVQGPTEKATALEEEARKAGLVGCPLARTVRTEGL